MEKPLKYLMELILGVVDMDDEIGGYFRHN
jgi:hypothetical protein